MLKQLVFEYLKLQQENKQIKNMLLQIIKNHNKDILPYEIKRWYEQYTEGKLR